MRDKETERNKGTKKLKDIEIDKASERQRLRDKGTKEQRDKKTAR
jgi:hypothetical protein